MAKHILTKNEVESIILSLNDDDFKAAMNLLGFHAKEDFFKFLIKKEKELNNG